MPVTLKSLMTDSGACNEELHTMIGVIDFKGDEKPEKECFKTIILATTDGAEGSDRPATTPESRVQSFLESFIRDVNLNTERSFSGMLHGKLDGNFQEGRS